MTARQGTLSLTRSGARLGRTYSSKTGTGTSLSARTVAGFIPLVHVRYEHIVPVGIPLGEQDQDPMPHQPTEKGQREPPKPPIGQKQKAHKEPQTGPGAGIEARGATHDNALPHPALDRHLIAMHRLCHYSVPPATRPSVPSMATPPPKIPALVKKFMLPARMVLNGLSIWLPMYPASPTPPIRTPMPVTPVANVVRKASRPGIPKPPAAAVRTPTLRAVTAMGLLTVIHFRMFGRILWFSMMSAIGNPVPLVPPRHDIRPLPPSASPGHTRASRGASACSPCVAQASGPGRAPAPHPWSAAAARHADRTPSHPGGIPAARPRDWPRWRTPG